MGNIAPNVATFRLTNAESKAATVVMKHTLEADNPGFTVSGLGVTTWGGAYSGPLSDAIYSLITDGVNGTFKLQVTCDAGVFTTGNLNEDDSAATVQAAIRALDASLNAATATGGILGTNPVVITLTGSTVGGTAATIAVTNESGVNATITQTQEGGEGNYVIVTLKKGTTALKTITLARDMADATEVFEDIVPLPTLSNSFKATETIDLALTLNETVGKNVTKSAGGIIVQLWFK